jgi:hypothetical protein
VEAPTLTEQFSLRVLPPQGRREPAGKRERN